MRGTGWRGCSWWVAACLVAATFAPAASADTTGASPTGTTTVVSVDATGRTPSEAFTFGAAVSSDGGVVAFNSTASLVPEDVDDELDVYVRDTRASVTVLTSVAADGMSVAGDAVLLGIAPDGRRITFLVMPPDGTSRILVRDLGSATTTPAVDGVLNTRSWLEPAAAVSPDGNALAYLAAGPGDAEGELREVDLRTGSERRIATANACLDYDCTELAVADTGDVAFTTDRALLPADANGGFDVYLWTRSGATLSRLSDAGVAFGPAISADGSTVAFWLPSVNVLWDRVSGDLQVIREGSYPSELWILPTSALSSDGRFVAVTSFLERHHDEGWDVFLLDRVTATLEPVALSDLGRRSGVEHESAWPAITADGRFVAFTSGSPDMVGGDANGAWDVFLRDRMGTAVPAGAPDVMFHSAATGTGWMGRGIDPHDHGGWMNGLMVEPGRMGRIDLRIRNEGTAADRFSLRGRGSNRWSRIAYRAAGHDVTRAVVAGTFATPVLVPGASTRVTVRIRVHRGVEATSRRLPLWTSAAGSSWSDFVASGVAVPFGRSERGADTWDPVWSRALGRELNAVATGPAGEVYVTGAVDSPNGYWKSMVVARFAPNGDRVWRRVWRQRASRYPYSVGDAVAVSPDGETVYVGGAELNDSTEVARARLWAITREGELRWAAVAWNRHVSYAITAVAADATGAVVGATSVGECGPHDGRVAAFDVDGGRVWQSPFEAPGIEGTGDVVDGVAIDPDGWVVTVGSIDRTPISCDEEMQGIWSDEDVMIQQLSRVGTVGWTQVLADGDAKDREGALGVAVLGDDVLVSSRIDGDLPDTGRAWLAAFSGAGEQRWTTTWGTATPGSTAVAVAGSRWGSAYVVGNVGGALFVRRISIDGVLVTERRRPGVLATGVATARGAVYIVGDDRLWRLPA